MEKYVELCFSKLKIIMLEKFNSYEKELLDETRKLIDVYPNADDLENYLLAEASSNNSFSTLVSIQTNEHSFVLPITSRKYHNRIISQLYHSEYFKTQYSQIHDIVSIKDLRQHVRWKPVLIPNSRSIITLNTSNNSDAILNSKYEIKRYRKKYRLFPTHPLEEDVHLIQSGVDRFNIINLGRKVSRSVELDFYKNRNDNTRRYYTLVNEYGERRCVLELQVQNHNKLTVHYINSYYVKDVKSKIERTGLNSYYEILTLAMYIAKELCYNEVTIDFGVIFNFPYKLKIPGTHKTGNTLIFVKEHI